MPVGDNVDSRWDAYLTSAIADWNTSLVIESPKAPGATDPRRCKPVAGRIEVCNARYGRTGWLGIAQIWLADGHISQGVTKLNDTYFDTAAYNTPAWRALVTCQEIGHDYGLGHQDEDFATDNTSSCMDYTDRPAGNEHPDAHDYGQLLTIYDHTEAAAATNFNVRTLQSPRGDAPQSEAAGGDTPADWGRAIAFTKDGRPHVFERTTASGRKMITHVFWAIGEGPRGPHRED